MSYIFQQYINDQQQSVYEFSKIGCIVFNFKMSKNSICKAVSVKYVKFFAFSDWSKDKTVLL